MGKIQVEQNDISLLNSLEDHYLEKADSFCVIAKNIARVYKETQSGEHQSSRKASVSTSWILLHHNIVKCLPRG